MNEWTNEELVTVVAAAHANSLAAKVELYLAAVDAFDAEGHAPFRGVRERAALARELAPAARGPSGSTESRPRPAKLAEPPTTKETR